MTRAILLTTLFALPILGCAAKKTPGVLSEGDDAEVIASKAFDASGGQAAFTRWKCGYVKYIILRGTKGQEGESTVEDTFDLPARFKRVEKRTGEKSAFTVAFVVEKGVKKVKRGDGVPEADGDDKEKRTEHEFAGLCSPAGMKGKKLKASALGKTRLDGKEALGLRVESPAIGWTDFYFERKTGLMMRSVTSKGKGPALETMTSDFREVQGAMVPMRLEVRSEGRLLMDVTIEELRFEKEMEAKAFALP